MPMTLIALQTERVYRPRAAGAGRNLLRRLRLLWRAAAAGSNRRMARLAEVVVVPIGLSSLAGAAVRR